MRWIVLVVGWAAMAPLAAAVERIWVYVGTYSRGTGSEGIYRCELDLETGELTAAVLVAEADNPSYLAASPDGKRLYAVEEIGDHEGGGGALHAFGIDGETGELRSLGRVSTGGAGPCHLSVDAAGAQVYFANYGGGSVGSVATAAGGWGAQRILVQHEGSSVHPQRQRAPHAHSIRLDPAGRRAYVADLGLDRIKIYGLGAAGELGAAAVGEVVLTPGAGPRQLAFRPDGWGAYVINELGRTVTALAADGQTGALEEVQTLPTVPEGVEGGSAAHIDVHPSGRFVYGSNRGHDSVAVYAADGASGKLSLVEVKKVGVETPRHFGIDPSGRFLVVAGQGSGDLAVFRIDGATGALEDVGSRAAVPSPVCVAFVRPEEAGFRAIFDGESLAGWEGAAEWFRVEDGCVVAGSLERAIPRNEFLVSERAYGDFELRLEAKLVGEGNNAGVQFWSERVPDHHEMVGFQCDIGSAGERSIWGALYDESRRRRFLAEAPLAAQRAVVRKDGWNQIRVRAKGDLIEIWANGAKTVHHIETEAAEEVPRRGRFGLQIHSGPPLEAWYRDIQLKEL